MKQWGVRDESDLWPVHTDDAKAVACAIIEIGDCNGLFAGRNPVLLGGGVDLEDMSSGGEDGLLPDKHTHTQLDESYEQSFLTWSAA